MLEVRLCTDLDDAGRLRLDAAGGPGYRSIVLDLDGLGVRDLCRVGDDVLVLAGPTMALDGLFRLYRWSGAVADRQRVVRSTHLTRLAELPSGRGADEGLHHPEGVTPLGDDSGAVLVVYDSPAPGRLSTAQTVLADVFPLDPSRSLAEPGRGPMSIRALHCIVPPHVLNHLRQSSDAAVREAAFATLLDTTLLRGQRSVRSSTWGAAPAQGRRTIFDCGHAHDT